MFSSDGDYSNFAGADFKDPDGHPKLSDKQKMAGAVWARPSQIMSTPTVRRPPPRKDRDERPSRVERDGTPVLGAVGGWWWVGGCGCRV